MRFITLFLLVIAGQVSAFEASSVVLTSNGNAMSLGGTLTLTASVSPGSATGKVTLYDGSAILGMAQLSSSVAVFFPRFQSSGARSLRAYYLGDGNNSPAASTPILVNVNAVAGVGMTVQAVDTPLSNGVPSAMGTAIGDFNGDGKADIVVANQNAASVSILLSNGNGTFQTFVSYPTGGHPDSVVVGDFNGDGIADLAVAAGSLASPSDVAILVGNGDGTFQGVSIVAAGNGTVFVAVGDFNADGKADLTVANAGGNNISILAGNGDGTFQTAANFATGTSPSSIAVADFNNDGKADLAVANSDIQGSSNGNVSILLGKGDGTFQAALTLPVGGRPSSIAVGDFDGDGKSDLALNDLTFPWLRVLQGNGDGSFQSGTNYAAGPGLTGVESSGVAICDVNGDGIDDLVVLVRDTAVGYLRIFPGKGDGTFAQLIDTNSFDGVQSYQGGQPGFLAVGDFNADARPDLALTGAGKLAVALGKPGQSQTVGFNSQFSDLASWAAPFVVSATASSGLAVTISSATPSVCTVSSNTVTLVFPGICRIVAAQPGNAVYAAATTGASFNVIPTGLESTVCTGLTANAVFLRAEGKTELLPDLKLQCLGGVLAQSLHLTLSVSPGVSITSATVGTGESAVNETLAGLNSSQISFAPGAAQGSISGNQITFNVPATSGVFTVTIANIRIDASQIPSSGIAPPAVTATLFVSGGASVIPAAFSATAGFVMKALTGVTSSGAASIPVCSPVTGSSPGFVLHFAEGYPNAFKIQGTAATNATLGSPFTNDTETGYGVTVGGGSNTASSGTRVKVVFQNIPANVAMYIPVTLAANGGTMKMTTSEMGAFSAVPASPGGPVGAAGVTAIGGTATVIYEETTSASAAVESYSIPVTLVAAAGTVAGSAPVITATISLAPVGAAASIPNFVSGSSTVTVNGSTFSSCQSTITFNTLGDAVFGSGSVTLSATSSSGLPVSFASTTPAVCTVSSNIVTLLTGGSCSIRSSQSGDSFYLPAPDVTRGFTVTQASQSISFPDVGTFVVSGSPISLSATATSGLPASYTSSTTSVCTVSGAVLSLLSPGICSITAVQAGNPSYFPAVSVAQSFRVFPSWGVTMRGQITTVAGTGIAGYGGDGANARQAKLNQPISVALDSVGNLYISDIANERIRKVDAVTGVITTVAGNGVADFGADGGLAVNTPLANPIGIVVDSAGNIYFAEQASNKVRKVTAATGIISTVAAAGLDSPSGVALDSSGNLFIANSGGHNIRKVVLATGAISTVAGSQLEGNQGDGFPATQAQMKFPFSVAVDTNGDLYIADSDAGRIRKVTAATGLMSTFAGARSDGLPDPGFAGDGGQASAAFLNQPIGLALDKNRNLYIADYTDSRVRVINGATGVINTIVGIGFTSLGPTGDGGPAVAAQLIGPAGIAVDPAGGLYIADNDGQRVRFVLGAPQILSQTLVIAPVADKTVTDPPFGITATAGSGLPVSLTSATPAVCTISGTAVTLVSHGVCSIWASQAGNSTYAAAGPIIANFNVVGLSQTIAFTLNPSQFAHAVIPLSAVAGSGLPVNYSVASTNTPQCKLVEGGLQTGGAWGTCTVTATQAGNGIYAAATPVVLTLAIVADRDTTQQGQIITVAGNGIQGYFQDQSNAAVAAELNHPAAVASDGYGNVYIADTGNNMVRFLNAYSSGTITGVAGTGTQGSGGDGGYAGNAQLNAPKGVAFGPDQSFYIADTGNNTIRRVGITGGLGNVITTVAGVGTNGYSGDGAAATAAQFSAPAGIAVDKDGNIYIADSGNNALRKIGASDGKVSTLASLDASGGVAVDAGGNVFIGGLTQVRKVAAGTNAVTVVAGSTVSGYSGDGGLATDALFHGPLGVSLDANGNLAIADSGNHRLRLVSASNGLVATVAGTGTGGYNGDGVALTSALNQPSGVAGDLLGNFYIADTLNNRVRFVRQPAVPVLQTQTIDFPAFANVNLGVAPFALTATASSGLTVVFTSNTPSVCTVSGVTLTILAVGNCSVTASQSGNVTISVAASVTRMFTVNASNATLQTIAFAALSSVAFGSGPVPLSATATSGLPVSFAAGDANVCTIVGTTVTLVSAGSCPIIAIQTGDAVYGAATPVTRVLSIVTAAQSITFNPLDTVVFGTGFLTISASASSGLPVSFSSNSLGICTVSGSKITVIGAGACSIAATQPGNKNYAAADTVTRTLMIAKASQSINFGVLGPIGLPASPFALTATASSGLTVSFSSASATTCTVSDVMLTPLAAGTCSITASQSGNANYLAAASVTQSFTINPAPPPPTGGGGGGGGVPSGSPLVSSPDSITVDAVVGGSPATKTLTLSYQTFTAGAPTFATNFTTNQGRGWLSVTPASGTMTLASTTGLLLTYSATFTIKGDPTDIPAGSSYTGTVNISAAGGIASIPVTLNVSSQPAKYNVAPQSISFSYQQGNATTPVAQRLSVFSVPTGGSFTTTASSTGNWLTVDTGGKAPATVSVSANVSGLTPGSYTGSVAITAGTTVINVPVSLTVLKSNPPALSVSSATERISLAQDAAASNGQVTVSNTGGGTLQFTASSDAAWLKLGASSSGSVTPGSPASLAFSVDPSGLNVGTYNGHIIVNDSVVTVVLTVTKAAAPTIQLSRSGISLTGVAGGAAPQSQSVAVSNGGKGTLDWTLQTSTTSGDNWLNAVKSGTSITISANMTGLTPGPYYGSVSVLAANAVNSPQMVSVSLNVVAPESTPGVFVSTGGVLLVGTAGGVTVSQNVTLFNSSSSALTWSATLVSTGGWLSVNPSTGSLNAGTNTIQISGDMTGLTAGVQSGTVILGFSDGSSSAINVAALVLPAGVTASARSGLRALASVAACPAGKASFLIPIFRSPANQSSVQVAGAVTVQAQVIDDCGHAITAAGGGSVQVTFSNGDAGINLNDVGGGVWEATWVPANAGASVALQVSASANGLSANASLSALSTVTVAVAAASANAAPAPTGIANAASAGQATPGVVAPGSYIAIYGTGLAGSGNPSATSLPLPTNLNGTRLFLGGLPMPLLYAGAGQVNALVPEGIAPNASYPLVVVRGTAQSVPVSLTVTQLQPGAYTVNTSGSGAGIVTTALTGALISSSNPAHAGDYLVIYATGLGTVIGSNGETQPADGAAAPLTTTYHTVVNVNVTVGGVSTPAQFAGLTPTFAGLYQINLQVPGGVPAGPAVPVTITATDVTTGASAVGNAVTIAVQ